LQGIPEIRDEIVWPEAGFDGILDILQVTGDRPLSHITKPTPFVVEPKYAQSLRRPVALHFRKPWTDIYCTVCSENEKPIGIIATWINQMCYVVSARPMIFEMAA